MRKCSVLVLVFLAAGTSILGGRTKDEFPKPTGYVNDFANVVDVPTKNRLAAICAEVDKKTNAQITVVTVQTLAGSPIEDYALHLFNEWGDRAQTRQSGLAHSPFEIARKQSEIAQLQQRPSLWLHVSPVAAVTGITSSSSANRVSFRFMTFSIK